KEGTPERRTPLDPGSAPQYLLLVLHGVGSQTPAPNLDPRFLAKLNNGKTRVDLEISFAKVTDSALYYCALTPTVTGNSEPLYQYLATYISRRREEG
ncbi:hypothetical protein DPEC_G00063380, partial [Dallia pectoralis]